MDLVVQPGAINFTFFTSLFSSAYGGHRYALTIFVIHTHKNGHNTLRNLVFVFTALMLDAFESRRNSNDVKKKSYTLLQAAENGKAH